MGAPELIPWGQTGKERCPRSMAKKECCSTQRSNFLITAGGETNSLSGAVLYKGTYSTGLILITVGFKCYNDWTVS